jgi:hypothetical protein
MFVSKRLLQNAAALWLALCSTTLPWTAAYAQRIHTPVDVALVIAIDSSGSISHNDWQMQMRGYAEAFRSREVQRAITLGAHERIAVLAFEWSSSGEQHVIMPWTVISSAEGADYAAQFFTRHLRVFSNNTSISGALLYAREQLARCMCVPERRVIDVSGDGDNNHGQPVAAVRDEIVAQGVTINGLPILNNSRFLEQYYRTSVTGGPGSFVLPAETYVEFVQAIRRKLVLELAALR